MSVEASTRKCFTSVYAVSDSGEGVSVVRVCVWWVSWGLTLDGDGVAPDLGAQSHQIAPNWLLLQLSLRWNSPQTTLTHNSDYVMITSSLLHNV